MISDDAVRRNIAANLARFLADRGWTPLELSRRTGDPQATIYGVCRGKHMPGAGILARISEATGVSVDRLIAPPPTPPPVNVRTGERTKPVGVS